MPLYLVRWPTSFYASLVRAHDPTHLLSILDQAGDPSGCTWWLYTGPLVVDFRIKARLEWPTNGEAGLESEAARVAPEEGFFEDPLQLGSGSEDAAVAMTDAVIRRAFPVLSDWMKAGDWIDAPDAEAEAVLRRELAAAIDGKLPGGHSAGYGAEVTAALYGPFLHHDNETEREGEDQEDERTADEVTESLLAEWLDGLDGAQRRAVSQLDLRGLHRLVRDAYDLGFEEGQHAD